MSKDNPVNLNIENAKNSAKKKVELNSLANRNNLLLPGVIRIRDAPFYLGMNKNIFRKEISPFLTKFPIGGVGVGVDRKELDLWIAYIKNTQGIRKQTPPWELKDHSFPLDTLLNTRKSAKKINKKYSDSKGVKHFEELVKKITSQSHG